ncbi:MAG: hypothetical protein ABIX01_22225 [Chitinophagaceae bacterium]
MFFMQILKMPGWPYAIRLLASTLQKKFFDIITAVLYLFLKQTSMLKSSIHNVITRFAAIAIVVVIIIPALHGGGAHL